MEDRCVCCGEIIPEGQQVCENCMKGESGMMKNGSGVPDPTPAQAMRGIRQEEKTQALEKKHGVYRGEVYQVLVECPSDNPESEKWRKKYKKNESSRRISAYSHPAGQQRLPGKLPVA